MGKKADENKKSAWERHIRLYRIITALIDKPVRRKFNYSYESPDPAAVSGPVILIANHTCAWDPLFIGAAMKRKHMYFVASEHILRWKVFGPILNYIVEPVPRKKASSGTGTVMMCLRHLRAGRSICLFAEGEQTWNGITQPIVPATGKLVRQSGATLVTFRVEGAYLSLPRWAKDVRKGMVYGHPVGIYPPDELKGMKPEDINDLINRDICFNTWDWQETQPDGPVSFRISGRKKGLAERIEKSVFTCPECSSIGSLVSTGDEIRCSCGACISYTDTGLFDPPVPFRNISEWETFDREEVRRRIDAACLDADSAVLFEDADASLTKISEGHSEEDLGTGRLSLEIDGGKLSIKVAGYSTDLEDISMMAPVLSNILLFSAGGEYCQIYSENANLRKYQYAWDYIGSK